MPQATLAEIRAKVERHVKNTYLKKVQAPAGVKPVLKAWLDTHLPPLVERIVRAEIERVIDRTQA